MGHEQLADACRVSRTWKWVLIGAVVIAALIALLLVLIFAGSGSGELNPG